MKKTRKVFTILFASLMMLTLFPSMGAHAQKIEPKTPKENTITLSTVVMPRKIYIEDKSFYSKNLPSRKRYYSEEHEGIKYEGYLTITEYQAVPGGYLGIYTGYISR